MSGISGPGGPGRREELDARGLRAVRAILVLAAVMIPVYGLFYGRWSPESRDSMAERLTLSVLALGALAATWTAVGRRMIWLAFRVLVYVFTFWQLRLVIVNRFGADHVITSMMVFAIVTTLFRERRELAAYCIVALTFFGGAALIVPDFEGNRFFLLTNLLLLLGALWMTGSARITSRQRLQESEEMRRMLVDQSRDALILIDPFAREALEWNRRADELLEPGPDRNHGEMASAAFGMTEMRDIDAVIVLKEIGTGGAYHRERAYLTRSGRTFWGDLSVISVRLGERMVLLARIVDASAWHRTEESLREEQKVYRRMAEQSGDFLARISPTGAIIEISPSVEALLGIPPRDLVGRPFRELVKREGRASLEGWPQVRAEESRYTLGRFPFLTKGGEGRWFECLAWHLVQPDTRVLVEAIVVGRDVSGAQAIEERIRR